MEKKAISLVRKTTTPANRASTPSKGREASEKPEKSEKSEKTLAFIVRDKDISARGEDDVCGCFVVSYSKTTRSRVQVALEAAVKELVETRPNYKFEDLEAVVERACAANGWEASFPDLADIWY